MRTRACDCYGTIHETERANYWKGVFPEDKIPLAHPLREGRAKTGTETYDFYKVDMARVSEDQLKEIVKRASAKFGITEEVALASSKEHGIPLKSDGVSVFWCSLHSRLVLPDFDDSEDYTTEEAEYDEEDSDLE